MDIFDAICGLVDAARPTAAPTLIRGIGGDRDIAPFGEMLGIQARDLFLHPTIRVRHDDRRIFLRRIVVCRGVDVGGNIQAIELIGDRVDIDLARFVLRDRAVINQRERDLLVVGCDSGCIGHCCNS